MNAAETNLSPAMALLKLRAWAKELPEPLSGLCVHALDNEGYGRAPGGKTRHHAYPGGLAVHTYEVTKRARDFVWGPAKGDLSILHVTTAAGILHDLGKAREYGVTSDESGLTIDRTKEGYLLGHLSMSYGWFVREAAARNLDYDLTVRVAHCILSHHGRREWGSPTEPQTLEAHALHSADMMSMQDAGGQGKK